MVDVSALDCIAVSGPFCRDRNGHLSTAVGYDTSANIRLCVAFAQTVQPKKPLSARRAKSGVRHSFSVFEGITLAAQGCEKGFKGECLPDRSIDILPHKVPQRGPALLFRIPLRIVLSVPF